MGCNGSKDSTSEHIDPLPSAPKKGLKQKKARYTEYVDDIASIRRAAKNMCLLYAHGWHIDAIKNTWDMTIKMWSPFECSANSVKDGKEYLDLRFSQAIELLEIQEGLIFPKIPKDEIGTYLALDHTYHKFRLVFVIGLEEKDTSCASLLFVASEQKGTECKLVAGHGLITIEGFRRSIGLPSVSQRYITDVGLKVEYYDSDYEANESEEFITSPD